MHPGDALPAGDVSFMYALPLSRLVGCMHFGFGFGFGFVFEPDSLIAAMI